MEKLWNKSGLILTSQPYLHERWAQVQDTLRSMTAGAAGTGGSSLDLVSGIVVLHRTVQSSPYPIGSLLEANLIKATEMESKQRKVANDFTVTFPLDMIQQWRRMVREWEANPS